MSDVNEIQEIKLGAEVDTMCSKCKLERGHVITAIVDGEIKKVRCNSCGYEHAFKKKTASKKKTKEVSTDAATSSPVTTAQYERVIGNRDLSEAKPYAFSTKFAEGDMIKHATFGTGIVTAVKDDHKISVMFPDRLRLLAHDRTSI